MRTVGDWPNLCPVQDDEEAVCTRRNTCSAGGEVRGDEDQVVKHEEPDQSPVAISDRIAGGDRGVP